MKADKKHYYSERTIQCIETTAMKNKAPKQSLAIILTMLLVLPIFTMNVYAKPPVPNPYTEPGTIIRSTKLGTNVTATITIPSLKFYTKCSKSEKTIEVSGSAYDTSESTLYYKYVDEKPNGKASISITGTGTMTNYTDPYVSSGTKSPFLELLYDCGASSVTIANGITTIGDFLFTSTGSELYFFTSVTIPASVTTIGKKAFYGATGSVGNGCKIQTLSLSSTGSLTTIGEEAFLGNPITSLTIPKSVTTIKQGAFNSCDLKSVTFASGSGLKTIEKNAFINNQALSSMTLPSSITAIELYAFDEEATITSTNSICPHNKLVAKEENRVSATTVSYGSYDVVTYCTICGSSVKTVHHTLGKVTTGSVGTQKSFLDKIIEFFLKLFGLK